jgi:phosphoribosyl 1,2-cyclic phosphodiesterase
VAYSSDVFDLPEAAFDVLAGVPLWIVDALPLDAAPDPRPRGEDARLDRAHPAGASGAHQLHIDMDYAALTGEPAAGVGSGVRRLADRAAACESVSDICDNVT